MKIKTLQIYGYGKWVNQTFDIDEQFQMFYGPNEIGKSTIQSFIKSVLFGFPDKRKRKVQTNRYVPKHSDVYGGRILLMDTPLGDVWVERTSSHLSLTTTSGEELPESDLQRILGGMDENLFNYFYCFNLQNLQDLSNIGSQDLNDFFLSIGTLGSDKFLSVAKQFEKDTDDLYKKQGTNPKLNQLLQEYEIVEHRLQELKDKNNRYDELIYKRNNENASINQLNHNISDLEQQIRSLDQLMSRYDTYLKKLKVDRELDRLVYTDIKEDTIDVVKNALRDNQESQTKLAELKERVRNIDEDLSQLTRLTWAQNHKDERDQWKQQTESVKETQTRIEQIQRQIEESEEMLIHLAQQGQFYPEKISYGQDYEHQIDEGLKLQGQKEAIIDNVDEVKAERKVLLDQRKQFQNHALTMRQQKAKLENQKVNDEERLIQMTKLSEYGLGLILLLAGGFGLIHNILQKTSITSVISIIALIAAVLGIVWISYIFIKHKNLIKEFQNNPLHQKIDELIDKETYYTQQSKDLGFEINDRELNLENLQNEIHSLDKQLQSWKTKLGFYPTADPELILKSNPVKHYFETSERLAKYKAESYDLNAQVETWKERLIPLFERFPFESDQTRNLIRHVEEVESSLIQTTLRADALLERKKSAQITMSDEELAIKSREETIQQILDESSSQNVADFNLKVSINKEIESLQDKKSMYMEQIGEHIAELEKIEDKQSLSKQYQMKVDQLNRSKESITPHMHQLANVMVEINQLEQDGTYSELTQSLEYLKEQIKDLMIQWGQKRIAMKLIYDTLRHGMDNPLPEMNERVNGIFSKLSQGRYTNVKFNQNSIKIKQFSDVMFEPHELSQGTLEQLYVSLRLAFVESAKQMVSMPIIIDDAFVNFDEIRKDVMFDVLIELSKNHQILFFTFDQLAIEKFNEYSNTNLESIPVIMKEGENSNATL